MIASYDRGFEYRKFQIAFDAIWCHKRGRLVTTNPDPYCPLPGGRGEPDAAIEGERAGGHLPELLTKRLGLSDHELGESIHQHVCLTIY